MKGDGCDEGISATVLLWAGVCGMIEGARLVLSEPLWKLAPFSSPDEAGPSIQSSSSESLIRNTSESSSAVLPDKNCVKVCVWKDDVGVSPRVLRRFRG